ncbi:hypothetical protein BH11MYX4_BH11MYX4_36570 [soil metagenome]
MSKRPTELTDPGPPPEDVLDATLRALGKPVRPPPRQTSESSGVDAAQYQGDAHLPPKAHHPGGRGDTMPMVSPTNESESIETVRGLRPKPASGSDLTTVPRAVPRRSKTATFVAALLLVLIVVGGATWALVLRSPGDEARGVGPAVDGTIARPTALASSGSETATAAARTPSSVQPPVTTSSPVTTGSAEPSATVVAPHAVSARTAVEARPAPGAGSSGRVAPSAGSERPAQPSIVVPVPVPSPARPSASSRDDLPKDPL